MKISEVSVLVHNALHTGQRSVQLPGGASWRIRVDPNQGVSFLRFATAQNKYEWIQQDSRPFFKGDNVLAGMVSAGHQITRLKLNEELRAEGVIDGMWVDNLYEHCVALVRQAR